jgi:hypothetical protein
VENTVDCFILHGYFIDLTQLAGLWISRLTRR